MFSFAVGFLAGLVVATVVLAALALRRLRQPGAQLALVVRPRPTPTAGPARRDPVQLHEQAVAVLNAEDPTRRRVVESARGASR